VLSANFKLPVIATPVLLTVNGWIVEVRPVTGSVTDAEIFRADSVFGLRLDKFAIVCPIYYCIYGQMGKNKAPTRGALFVSY
jgi:hypothetical protein